MKETPESIGDPVGMPGQARIKKAFRLIAALLFLLVMFIGGGFAHFAAKVATNTPPADVSADGIVVLTGGAARISGAVSLLQKGSGKRLLISGVHPDTTSNEIARQLPTKNMWFNCCIDLDYGALNTVGNAKAARAWAKDNGFSSLVIVTSAYHMPRSMMEFSRVAPDIAIKAYPVHTNKLILSRWWADPKVMRLMVAEYGKYLLARIRLRLGQPATTKEARAAVN